MQRLIGKVAIVTGASVGIGRETAKLFAREGAKLVVAARRESELETLTSEIVGEGGNAEYLAGDVRSEDFAKALVALAVNCFGRLDIACNNVGILGEIDPTFSVSETGWTNSMEANLTSAFFGAKYQIPEILKQGGGSIFFMATFVDRSFSLLGGAAYAAGNFGLIGLTRALAAEDGTQGMRVNAFLPGAVDASIYPDAATLEHLLGYFEAGLSPAEAAQVCFARKH